MLICLMLCIIHHGCPLIILLELISMILQTLLYALQSSAPVVDPGADEIDQEAFKDANLLSESCVSEFQPSDIFPIP